MTRQIIETELKDAIDRLRADGHFWWPGSEMAPIAYRRLASYSRRNESKQPTDENRIADLIKGLQAYFDQDKLHVHVNDWRALATILVAIFCQQVSPET